MPRPRNTGRLNADETDENDTIARHAAREVSESEEERDSEDLGRLRVKSTTAVSSGKYVFEDSEDEGDAEDNVSQSSEVAVAEAPYASQFVTPQTTSRPLSLKQVEADAKKVVRVVAEEGRKLEEEVATGVRKAENVVKEAAEKTFSTSPKFAKW